MPSRPYAVGGALLLALLAPAAASAAPTMQPLQPCYVTVGEAPEQREAIAISATGFTPNSKVDVLVDGVEVGDQLQTDQTGTLNVPPNTVAAPHVASGTKAFTVTLNEVDAAGAPVPGQTVSAEARTTALGVTVKPRRARPSSQVRFRGRGFTGDKAVYAHYIYKGKVRKTVRMARKTGTCGEWRARRPQIPVDDPKTGSWIVQFDQSKKAINPKKPTTVFVRLEIEVTLERG